MPDALRAVSCHDIAGIWVAFFSRCQRYRYGQARLFNTLAIEAVPPTHPLAPLLQKELAALVPHLPATPLPPRRTASKFSEPVVCGAAGMAEKVTMTFDPMSGSIRQLGFGKGGAWSELMDLRYITYSGCS